jgi:hypothetical protein
MRRQEEDQREQDDRCGDDGATALQALPRPRSRRQAQSGVLNAASFAFSSGDIGSLTATRT